MNSGTLVDNSTDPLMVTGVVALILNPVIGVMLALVGIRGAVETDTDVKNCVETSDNVVIAVLLLAIRDVALASIEETSLKADSMG